MKLNCSDCPYEDKKCPCIEKTIKDIVRVGNRNKARKETDINFYMRERHHKRHRKTRRD